MNKEQFAKLCNRANTGKDTFVCHPESSEEGRIISCTTEEVVVNTGLGHRRNWDYHECSEISGFGKSKTC